jgi:hypothetical protein
MKNILILFFLCCLTFVHAQSFEGVITWKITMDLDPATKAKMDAAQRQMNDPDTQAKMKEMQEKMNDPQVKAMMESNPQLKAQMEAMIKASQGGDVNSMMPTGLVVKIKGSNSLTKMDGGIMGNMEMLYVSDKNITYRLDREAKTYAIVSRGGTDTIKVSDVKVTKTSETTKVLGYTCTKYLVESTIQGQQLHQILWASPDIKGLDMKSLAKQRMGNGQQAIFYEKVEGIPLKMELKQPQGSMVMEAVDLKKQSLPASEFSLPAGFKEVH